MSVSEEKKGIGMYINSINEIFKQSLEEYGECFESCEIKETSNGFEAILKTKNNIIKTIIKTTVTKK